MIIDRQQLEDFVVRDLKRIAKKLYRRPLIELARQWRRQLVQPSFIGITGSAGKTTTKDMLHLALARRHRCVKSKDSNNQLYNVARTLLAVGPRTRFCIQEVGLSQPDGIRSMAELLRPQVGVVTNVGQDHLKSFRSSEAIAAEKSRLIEQLPASGLAVLNADDALVSAMARRTQAAVVTFGLGTGADVRGEVLEARWPARLAVQIRHRAEAVRIDTQLCGAHHAISVLAAFAAAVSLGVTVQDAAAAIGAYEPILGRATVHRTRRGITFIRDDLKAPEWSLGAVLQFMAEAEATRKIAVIGTLSDYSGRSRGVYRRAVSAALAATDYVLMVGDLAPHRAERWRDLKPGRLHGFATVRAAADWLHGFLQPDDLVLLKGSINADHLARIALSFDQPVGCWRHRCPRHIFCDHCRLLRHPAEPRR